ncbi:MAG: class I SAM-dependent methyltransferase [Bacteroidales bacterium]|nr:class I SAM-dependent methyltransferase [Bacteroidales bacterium]
MNNENKSIHEFDFSLICEYYSGIHRQGPGSEHATINALGFIENLDKNSLIADIGCGTGGQTMVLAQNTEGFITAVDLFPDFIEIFNQNASKLRLNDRVKGLVGSMDNLAFEIGTLDLIWSEGAIYNIGFEKGLNEWRKFLKTNGYIAVTEVSWLTENRPKEIEDFWIEAYPEIDLVSKKISQMEKAGYSPTASFVLPEQCWTKNFYEPQVELQKEFLNKHSGNKTAEELVANQQHEAIMYRKYKEFYGYVFYIGKKVY